MDRVEDGSIQITEEYFPSFVYDKDTLYDKDNDSEDLGLFRGYLLVGVYRHIFTGPSSATSMSQWKPNDNFFSLHGFYNNNDALS